MRSKLLTAVAVLGLSCTITNVAVASNANRNLCDLTQSALHSDGFSEQAVYKAAAIQKLLKRAGVIVDLSSWDPNQLYSFSYSCKMDHGVTYPSLIAAPVDVPALIPGVITWDATPPTSY